MSQLDLVLAVLDFLQRHPRLKRAFARRVVSSRVGRVLPFVHRGMLGMSAFDLHDLDAARGEIAFGGVREVIFGAGWLRLFHEGIGGQIGADAKNRLLYAIAKKGTTWEIKETLRDTRWVPSALKEAIAERRLIASVRRDPKLGRFFQHLTREVSRLIITEGGWGNVVEYAFESGPIRVVLTEGMEAKMCGPAPAPTCYITAGGIAGYLIGLTDDPWEAREIRCRSVTGGGVCEFEVTLGEEPASERGA